MATAGTVILIVCIVLFVAFGLFLYIRSKYFDTTAEPDDATEHAADDRVATVHHSDPRGRMQVTSLEQRERTRRALDEYREVEQRRELENALRSSSSDDSASVVDYREIEFSDSLNDEASALPPPGADEVPLAYRRWGLPEDMHDMVVQSSTARPPRYRDVEAGCQGSAEDSWSWEGGEEALDIVVIGALPPPRNEDFVNEVGRAIAMRTAMEEARLAGRRHGDSVSSSSLTSYSHDVPSSDEWDGGGRGGSGGRGRGGRGRGGRRGSDPPRLEAGKPVPRASSVRDAHAAEVRANAIRRSSVFAPHKLPWQVLDKRNFRRGPREPPAYVPYTGGHRLEPGTLINPNGMFLV